MVSRSELIVIAKTFIHSAQRRSHTEQLSERITSRGLFLEGAH